MRQRACKQEQETDQQASWIGPHVTNHPLDDLAGLAFVAPKLPSCRVTDKRESVTKVSVYDGMFGGLSRVFKFHIQGSGQLLIHTGLFQPLHLCRQMAEELPVGFRVVAG